LDACGTQYTHYTHCPCCEEVDFNATLSRFQNICGTTRETLKMTTFWDIVLCSLKVDQRFRGVYCLNHKGVEFHLYPKRLSSSYLPPQQPEISHRKALFGKVESKVIEPGPYISGICSAKQFKSSFKGRRANM
jgi:hypothetical protein